MPYYENSSADRLWYEDQGSGAPIIFIHGWSLSSAVWHFQFEQLSSSFRLIAPDLRGHGLSSALSGYCDLESFSTDIMLLCEKLDLQNVLLVGWSLGGQIAINVSARLKERLSGLLLLCSTPCFCAKDDFQYGLSRLEVDGMTLKLERSMPRAIKGFIGRMFATGEIKSEELPELNKLLEQIALPDKEVAISSLKILQEMDLRELLSTIELPTLIISGEEDLICPPAASVYLAEQIPDSRYYSFDGCGHAPFLTRAAVMNKILSGFHAGKVIDIAV